MMKFNHTLFAALMAALVLAPAIARADSFHLADPKPLDELWMNAGFYSYHFQHDINLDSNNIGLGFEYRYTTVNSVTAGRFHNSDLQMSEYVAWYWQPITWGPVRLGGIAGMIDGYPQMQNGAWFPLLLPVASLEYKRIGLNLTIIPSYQSRLHGSVSLQFKFKLY